MVCLNVVALLSLWPGVTGHLDDQDVKNCALGYVCGVLTASPDLSLLGVIDSMLDNGICMAQGNAMFQRGLNASKEDPTRPYAACATAKLANEACNLMGHLHVKQCISQEMSGLVTHCTLARSVSRCFHEHKQAYMQNAMKSCHPKQQLPPGAYQVALMDCGYSPPHRDSGLATALETGYCNFRGQELMQDLFQEYAAEIQGQELAHVYEDEAEEMDKGAKQEQTKDAVEEEQKAKEDPEGAKEAEGPEGAAGEEEAVHSGAPSAGAAAAGAPAAGAAGGAADGAAASAGGGFYGAILEGLAPLIPLFATPEVNVTAEVQNISQHIVNKYESQEVERARARQQSALAQTSMPLVPLTLMAVSGLAVLRVVVVQSRARNPLALPLLSTENNSASTAPWGPRELILSFVGRLAP